MLQYLVRQLDNKHFQIAKFEDSSLPTETYEITKTLSNGWYHCNCMGFRRNQSQDHKHIVMCQAFEDNGTNLFDGEFNGDKFLDD